MTVDYYLPGCPPPVTLIVEAVTAIVRGELPPSGSVLAPDIALCNDCPRIDTKPDEPFLREFKRPHEVLIDPGELLPGPGAAVHGPGHALRLRPRLHQRQHALHRLPRAGQRRARPRGGAPVGASPRWSTATTTTEIAAMIDQIPDPAGTFYRYGLPASMLFRRVDRRRKRRYLIMARHITIDPITRLEGHGKIDIFLNDEGDVDRAYFQVPELRGFEKFAAGPTGRGHAADHLADLRRLPDGPPHGGRQGTRRPVPRRARRRPAWRSANWSTTRSCSRTTRCTSTSSAGPTSWSARRPARRERNILGVIGKVGVEVGKKVIAMRRAARELITLAGGKVIHPVLGLPGGVAKPLTRRRSEAVHRGGASRRSSSPSSACRSSTTSCSRTRSTSI